MEKTDILDRLGFTIEDYNSAMVYRLEYLLEGAPFSDLEKIVNENLDSHTQYLQKRLKHIEESITSLPSQDEDEEFLSFLQDVQLFKMNIADMNHEQRRRIVQLFNSAVNSIENNMKRLERTSKRYVASEERFDEDAIYSDDLLGRIRLRLADIIEEPQRLFLQNKLHDIQRQIAENETDRNDRLSLAINRDIFFERLPEVIQILEKLKSQNKTIRLVIDDNGTKFEENNFDLRIPYNYTEEEIDLLQDVIKRRGLVDEAYFSEFYEERIYPFLQEDMWSYEDVVVVNSIKNGIVNDVSELNLSPLESVIHILRYISNMRYSGNANNSEFTRTFLTGEDSYTEQDEIELMKKGRAYTCGSVASYVKAFIDCLHNSNVRAQIVNEAYYDRESGSKRGSQPHIVLVLYVNDEKYGVLDNYTLLDPVAIIENCGLSGAFIPISDISNYYRLVVVEDGKNFSKLKNLVITRRPERVSESYTANTEFYRKFGDKASSFSFETLVDIIKNYFTAVKSDSNYVDFDEDVETKTVKQLTEDLINLSLGEIDLNLNIYRAQGPLYKYCRKEFYKAKAEGRIDDEITIEQFPAEFNLK